MINSELISRYKNFKNLVITKNINFDVGKYWSNHKNFFDCELTENGPKNLGKVNYLEIEIKKNEELNLYKNNFLKINEKIFKRSSQIEVLEYYFEIITSQTKKNLKNILEIGAGGGILSSLLRDKFKSKITIVDIPDMILVSSAQLINIFPNANLCFPNEVNEKTNMNNFDIIFLLPNQINLISKEKFDLAINTESFMEMDYKEVKKYFETINLSLKDKGLFFTSNRIRKVQYFFKYPWKILSSFKKILLLKHKIFKNKNTHLILLMKKNKGKVYKNNSISFLERLYFNNAYGYNEFIFWFKRDIKNFLKTIINKIFNREIYKIIKF